MEVTDRKKQFLNTTRRRTRSSRHLFIVNGTTKSSKQESQSRHNPKSARKIINLNIIFFTVCLAFNLSTQVINGLSESKTILPTVIVRGFLNYRTTVDGTVLLFTPDAGSGSGQTTQAISSTSTVFQASSVTRTIQALQIESTSTRSPATFSIYRNEVAEPQQQSSSFDDWRPIQATPSLRPIQTTFKPILSSSYPSPDQISSSPFPTEEHKVVELVAENQSQSPLGDTTVNPRITPSVQSDDILISDSLKHLNANEQADSSANKPPNVDIPPTTATMRPKRPSLGFNGQGQRFKQSEKVRANNIQAHTTNTINGIRRPGFTTTSTTTPASVSNADSSTSASASAFQNRLANASSKLRGKFKRPPTSSNTSLPTHATTALTPPSESGEDLAIVSDQLSSFAPAISPDQASLQPRVGEILNASPSSGGSPVVGSDEISSALTLSNNDQKSESSQNEQNSSSSDTSLDLYLDAVNPTSRLGEQKLRADSNQKPQLLSGGLSGPLETQQGDSPLSFDGFFQNDQPNQHSVESSDHHVSHNWKDNSKPTRPNNNEKLNGWMDQHNNRFIARPNNQVHDSGHLSQQLAANLNNLAPSFTSNLPSTSAIKPSSVSSTPQLETLKPTVGSVDELKDGSNQSSLNVNSTTREEVQMQTITKTYSTVMTSLKTRLVPLQVKSSTAIHTITENYVITKMLTAYQTMPIGEFILPETMNTRSPFEMFNEVSNDAQGEDKSREQPIPAPSHHAAAQPAESTPQQEQPINLDTSPKSANDWLHDFTNGNLGNDAQANQLQSQQNLASALLEQQAQEANLAGFPLGEPLDQLASSLDPAALLADGTINIPDLNNPLVLAAAIQNPQLAAVILAAQQLRLKQRNKLNTNGANNQNQQQIQPIQLQPSYSTSLSTVVRPTTYTVRDTMYTTRLVSFKDGRTVRTRTVSEPGSIIEQVLTTMATEITPVTITIRPTGMFTVPTSLSTALPGGQTHQSSQSTIDNALFATQLASILARRQQQLQPSLQNNGFLGSASNSNQHQQLAALQQILAQQNQQNQAAKQFQPNLQQMLQSMQQQPSTKPSSLANNNKPSPSPSSQEKKQLQQKQQQQQQQEQGDQQVPAPTQMLTTVPNLQTAPLVTTLTSLQVRTYTVHNAFKTIYRTITSTQLILTTLLPAGGVRNTQLPNMG